MAFDMDPEEFDTLRRNICRYVEPYMSKYDGSHDYKHIQRVVKLTLYLYQQESYRLTTGQIQYDKQAVILAALLHDVADKKYAKPGEMAAALVIDVLVANKCPEQLATKVADIVDHVSYSNEINHPETVQACLRTYPELALVQDADRLDAIGAVGIARTFTYGGAARPKDGLDATLDHFTDKLEKLEGMMKTQTGRKMARERTQRLQTFRQWFEEEESLEEDD